MKRFGICFSTRRNSMKSVAFVDAISDQGALFWFQMLNPHEIHCIHNVIEWKEVSVAERNYILSAV